MKGCIVQNEWRPVRIPDRFEEQVPGRPACFDRWLAAGVVGSLGAV